MAGICLLPADHPHGSDSAGHCPLRRVLSARRLVARILLRRQHAWRRLRLPAGGLLSARPTMTSIGRPILPSLSTPASDRAGHRFVRFSDYQVADRKRSPPPSPALPCSNPALGPSTWHARPLGPDGTRVGGDLDPPVVPHARRHGLHVLQHPRGLPPGVGHRQQHRLVRRPLASKQPKIALAWCQFLLAASIAWAAYADFLFAALLALDLRASPRPWSTFPGEPCPVLLDGFPRSTASGAPVSRWDLPHWSDAARTRASSSAASMPPTPSGRSSARCCSRWSTCNICGSQNAQRICCWRFAPLSGDDRPAAAAD